MFCFTSLCFTLMPCLSCFFPCLYLVAIRTYIHTYIHTYADLFLDGIYISFGLELPCIFVGRCIGRLKSTDQLQPLMRRKRQRQRLSRCPIATALPFLAFNYDDYRCCLSFCRPHLRSSVSGLLRPPNISSIIFHPRVSERASISMGNQIEY